MIQKDKNDFQNEYIKAARSRFSRNFDISIADAQAARSRFSKNFEKQIFRLSEIPLRFLTYERSKTSV